MSTSIAADVGDLPYFIAFYFYDPYSNIKSLFFCYTCICFNVLVIYCSHSVRFHCFFNACTTEPVQVGHLQAKFLNKHAAVLVMFISVFKAVHFE